MIVAAVLVYSFAVALVYSYRLRRAFRWYRWQTAPPLAGNDNKQEKRLPSLSVCIPARNEAHALAQCLEYVLSSDYPKMEIVVFDDGSRDDTSLLIKSFAHAGVRFIPGKPLPDGWVGKTHALNILAEEASGEILVFLDVDTLIAPFSLSHIVAKMQADSLDIVSIVPQRQDTHRASALFSTLRYYWEMILATRQQPASSSSLWLLRRSYLASINGGFSSVKTAAQPERAFAEANMAHQQTWMSTPGLGVYYEKRLSSQLETGQRLAWPLARRNLLSLLLVMSGMLAWVIPVVCMVYGALITNWNMVILSLGVLVVWCGIYWYYAAHAWTHRQFLAFLVWPYVALQDSLNGIVSVVKYATGNVRWKGRSIHANVMNHSYLTIDE